MQFNTVDKDIANLKGYILYILFLCDITIGNTTMGITITGS